ncbi:hypothetical protein JOF53_006576 [Crossiella equi]|uniref:Uncharacterized protein n=1 Tax=Crossiella equi TaxID=130796 RepID=A0ABS5AMB4_9PSEU|nr:hypothetical protein [Crossiella equi]MBP2477704.1 hypothetical protein [Crossiella equi]
MVFSTLLSSLAVAASTLAPAAPAAVESMTPSTPGTAETVMCEFVVKGATWVYRKKDFRLEDPAPKLVAGTRVWASSTTSINSNYNATVRYVSGPEVGWAFASELARVAGKCYPL